MAKFNPITDLMPIDSSNESVDESSEQIKVIRTQLIQTRNSLSNVVNIIKTKNSLLDRDLDKIKSLNDRLQRTIPRIPIMRGKAGVLFGDTIEEEKKKGSLKIPMFPFRVPMEEEVVTYSRPIVKQAADIVGNIFNIGLILGFTKSLLSKPKVTIPKVTIPTPKPSPGSVNVGDDLAKIIQDIIKKRKEQGLDVVPLEKTLKSIFKGRRRKEILKNMSNLKRNQREGRRSIIRRKGEELLYDMQAKGEIKGDLLGDKNMLSILGRATIEKILGVGTKVTKRVNRLFQTQKSAVRRNITKRTGKSIEMEQAEETYNILQEAVKQSKIKGTVGGEESMNLSVQALRTFQEGLRTRIKLSTSPGEKRRLSEALKFLEGKTEQLLKVIEKQNPKLFKKLNPLFLFEGKPVKSDIGSPKSNNIASLLNTDTGITNTVIIITDPPTA